MLSPTLLETLRSYWRAVRPKDWLFPGGVAGYPITENAVEQGCQKARRLCRISKPINAALSAAISVFHPLNRPNPLIESISYGTSATLTW